MPRRPSLGHCANGSAASNQMFLARAGRSHRPSICQGERWWPLFLHRRVAEETGYSKFQMVHAMRRPSPDPKPALQESLTTGESKAMAAKKRSIKHAQTVGQDLAKEVIRGRKSALQARKAALVTPTGPAKKAAKSASASASIRTGKSAGILIAEGDSWFDYPFNDVLKNLEDQYGYDVESVAHAGDRVEDMAYSAGQLDEFIRRIEKVMRRGDVPRAILLSGGGNDIAGEYEFGMLINHARSSKSGLNESIVAGVIDQRLFEAYATILAAVTDICVATIGKKIPIFVHGYDYAIPDGRGFMGGFWLLPGPWLEPGFRQKGYEQLSVRKPLIVNLINRFNNMLKAVTAAPAFSHVKYVDLRNTLSTGTDYQDAWANELHPTKRGFAAVTEIFAKKISGTPVP